MAANTSTWNALILLNAKLSGNVTSSFKRLEGMMNKLGHTAKHVTGMLTGMFLGFEAFRGVSFLIGDATKKAWEFDKAWARIQQSIMSGSSGRTSSSSQESLANQFNFLKNNAFQGQIGRGANPEFLTEVMKQMSMGGLSSQDQARLLPGITDRLLAQDMDLEKAHELGRSVTRFAMKNQPLHLTRSDQFFGGMDEKSVKLLFKGKNVMERISILLPYMTKQFGGMAEALMKTDEGAVRLGQNFAWIYEYKFGEVIKGMQVDFARFWDWLAPRFLPIFSNWMDGLRSFASWAEGVLKGWADVVLGNWQTLTMWWEFQFKPRVAHILKQTGDDFENFWNKISKLMGGGKDPLQDFLNGVTMLLKILQDPGKAMTDLWKGIEDDYDRLEATIKVGINDIWTTFSTAALAAIDRILPGIDKLVGKFDPILNALKALGAIPKDAGVSQDPLLNGKSKDAVDGGMGIIRMLMGLPPLQKSAEQSTEKINSMSGAVDKLTSTMLADTQALQLLGPMATGSSGAWNPGGNFGLHGGETGSDMGNVVGGDRIGEFGNEKRGAVDWDKYSEKGEGAYNKHMTYGYSAGLTAEGARLRGLTHHNQTFKAADGKTYRWDDTAPKHQHLRNGKNLTIPDNYIDVYKGGAKVETHLHFYGMNDRDAAKRIESSARDALRRAYA